MEKFKSGNVVQTPYGFKIIIVGYQSSPGKTYRLFNWVSFDSSNVSGSTQVDKHYRTTDCRCLDEEIEGCIICGGSGIQKIEVEGEEAYTVIGDCVSDYLKELLQGALKQL